MPQKKWQRGKWPALILALTLASSLMAQDVQIRTRVDLVVVPVTVENQEDTLVTGLNQHHFDVYEDGQKQTITNFDADPVPISAVLLIDNDLSPEAFSKVQASLPALAGAFADVDEVAVYRYGKFITKLSDFSSDALVVQTALKTLDDIKPSVTGVLTGPFSTAGPIVNGIPVNPTIQLPRPFPAPPTRVLNDAIFMATEDLASRARDRRKIIMVVSDGQNKGSDHSYEDTRDRLLYREVQVYAMGMDDAILSRQLSVLDSYADDTGGDTCFLNSQLALEKCYAHSIEQARYQYVLGYISSQKVSGRIPVYREIRVVLPGTNYDTRHRRGYFQAP